MSGTVFISYSRTNSKRAEELEQWLQNEVGIPTFYDKKTIEDGHAWRTTIKRWLDTSFAVIVLVSKASMKSHNVTFEWSYALGQSTYIIPLVIERDLDIKHINDFLTDTQFNMNFVEPKEDDWNTLRDRLLNLYDLSNIPNEVQQATELARSPIPDNQVHAINLLEEYPDKSALRELQILAVNDNLLQRQVDAALSLARKSDYSDNLAIEGLKRAVGARIYRKAETALSYLGKINTPESAQAVYELLHSSYTDKGKIVDTLLQVKSDVVSQLCLDLLENTNTPKKLDIIRYLYTNGHFMIVDIIETNLKQDNTNWVIQAKVEFYEMLSNIVDERVPDLMFDALTQYKNISYREYHQITELALKGLVNNSSDEVKDRLTQFQNQVSGTRRNMILDTLRKMRQN